MEKELLLAPVNSVWICYMEANCVLLSDLFIHNGFGSREALEPVAHPRCTSLHLDPQEGKTYLQEILSL